MKLLKYLNVGQERFEMDHFVAGSGVTPYGIFQQCLREINTRLTAFKSVPRDFNSANEEWIAVGHLVRELVRYFSIAVAMRQQLPDNLDAYRDELAKDKILTELKLKIAVNISCFGGLSGDLLAAILTLPTDDRAKLMEFTKDPAACAEYLLTQPRVDLASIPTLSLEELRSHCNDNRLRACIEFFEDSVSSAGYLLEDNKVR